MTEFTGDHRKCSCESAKNATQDVSWKKECVFCQKDLSEAPKG